MLFNHTCTFFFIIGTTQNNKSYEIIPSGGHAAAQRDCPKQNVPRKANNREDYKMAEARYFARPTSVELGRKCILLFHRNFFTTIKDNT
jgi:hypothetical protein